MKYEKSITINMGNYNSMRIGCTEADSFEEIDVELAKEIKKMGIDVPLGIKHVLKEMI